MHTAKFDRCVADVIRSGSAASPYAVCQKSVGRGNPAADAADLSRAFHGREPKAEIVIDEARHEHKYLAGLGPLEELDVLPPRSHSKAVRIRFGADTLLASNEAGTQLYVVGGDQELDLDSFVWLRSDERSKELVEVGRLARIIYVADKAHLGDKYGPYEHTFGEDGGEMPTLMYDRLNAECLIAGGTYHIDRDMDGGRTSAGIRQ